MSKEQTANASAQNNNNRNNNDVDDWCEIEEVPSVKWTPYYKSLMTEVSEHGNNILSALGELVYFSLFMIIFCRLMQYLLRK